MEMKDRNGVPLIVQSTTSDGTQAVVTVHFGSKQRTFAAAQWELLDAQVRSQLGIEIEE
ncbi:MAG: hypothetical protein AB7G08_23910 [Hyphomicrobiaceae bacterium]